MRNKKSVILPTFILILSLSKVASSQIFIELDLGEKYQTIDGFGAHQGSDDRNQSWWLDLFYHDMESTIYRVDLTPNLISPYSDLSYFSPWFMGSQTNSVFNLEDPDNPNGPEDNRVRTYTSPEDYTRTFGGENAPIAVMGPDIEENISYFTYSENKAIQEGKASQDTLGDFKLIGSFWSPLPWVKQSSGNNYGQNWWPGPVQGSAWPFIWGGNFAGGMLDVSDTPLEVFNDAELGGSGPTSSLTQFARSTAAYIKGYQDYHGIQFYAISIQNELNFEEFYNSATYPLASGYITAVKEIRSELDKYESLKGIKIMGPEDLLGGDPYGMWQYGGGDYVTHKNLQYLREIEKDPVASAAIEFYCIHGYDRDGVSAADASTTLWDWWVQGWDESPAAGIPSDIAGFESYGKKSWMTETSGEDPDWLSPLGAFPSDGAFGLGLRIHQAFTAGQQSAWVYWTFSEAGDNGEVTEAALTNQQLGAQSPKYVAAKHFFKYIRPESQRISATSSDLEKVVTSAYFHEQDLTTTIVLLNLSAEPQDISIDLNTEVEQNQWTSHTSSENNYWNSTSLAINDPHNIPLTIPAYGISTITGQVDYVTSTINSALNTAHLTAFPNPVTDLMNISLKSEYQASVNIQLLDTKGKIIQKIHSGKIKAGTSTFVTNIQSIPPGVYYVKLKINNRLSTQKIIKVVN